MFVERIVRNIANVHLQFFQIFDAKYLLLCFGVGNDEIAKTEVIFDRPAQILREGF